jgi:ubiquinone/menaquinone biosynthesis C-methylase UbiE
LAETQTLRTRPKRICFAFNLSTHPICTNSVSSEGEHSSILHLAVPDKMLAFRGKTDIIQQISLLPSLSKANGAIVLDQSISNFAPTRTVTASLARKYDRAADKWHKSLHKNGYLAAYSGLFRTAFTRLPVDTNQGLLNVLDAGAGTGGFSLAFCDAVDIPKSIDLLDISKQMLISALENLRARGQSAQMICAPIQDLDPAAKQYDVVLCAHALEHCANPTAALRVLRSVMLPGGLLVLSVSKPHWCTSLIRLLWGHKAWTAAEVKTMLKAAGFTGTAVHQYKSGPPKHTSQGYVATLGDTSAKRTFS